MRVGPMPVVGWVLWAGVVSWGGAGCLDGGLVPTEGSSSGSSSSSSSGGGGGDSSSAGEGSSSGATSGQEPSSGLATSSGPSSALVPGSTSAGPPPSSGARSSSGVAPPSSGSTRDGGVPWGDGGLLNFDASLVPYEGTPEPGVSCDDAVCAPDGGAAVCCVGYSGAACTEPGNCGGLSGLAVTCDGPEDCTPPQVCCFGLTGAACVAADACVSTSTWNPKYTACNSTHDCPLDWGCCQSEALMGYVTSLDFGACLEGCNLQP